MPSESGSLSGVGVVSENENGLDGSVEHFLSRRVPLAVPSSLSFNSPPCTSTVSSALWEKAWKATHAHAEVRGRRGVHGPTAVKVGDVYLRRLAREGETHRHESAFEVLRGRARKAHGKVGREVAMCAVNLRPRVR